MDFRSLSFEQVSQAQLGRMHEHVAIASDGEKLTVLYTENATEEQLAAAVRSHTFDGKRVRDIELEDVYDYGTERTLVSVTFF